MGETLYTGAAVSFADSINGLGRSLSGVDCGVGVPVGAKCFVAQGSQYWTLLIADEGVQVGVKQGAAGSGMDWKVKVQITGCYI